MSTKGRGSAYTLERLFLFITVSSIMLPLSIEWHGIGIALFDIPLAGLLAMWLLRAVTRRSHERWITHWDLVAAALVVWVTASTLLRAPDEIRELTMWASAFLLAYYARRNWGRVFDFAFMRRFAFAAIGFQLLIGLLQLATDSKIGNVQDYFGQIADDRQKRMLTETIPRMVGTLGAPNGYGNWLVALLPFVSLQFLAPKSVTPLILRSISIAMTGVAFLCLAVSVTRVNTVVAVLMIFAHWLVLRIRPQGGGVGSGFRSSQAVKLAVSVGVALALVAVVFNVVEDQLYGFSGLAMDRLADTDQHLGLRMEQYRGAVVAIAAHPFLGVGFANSGTIWDFVDVQLPRKFIWAPHNVYLIVATEGGLPALALFLVMLWIPVGRYLRAGVGRYPGLDTMAVSVTTFLLVFMTYVVPIRHGIWPLFMFLLGALLGAASHPRPEALEPFPGAVKKP